MSESSPSLAFEVSSTEVNFLSSVLLLLSGLKIIEILLESKTPNTDPRLVLLWEAFKGDDMCFEVSF